MFIITLLFVFILFYKLKFAGINGYFDDYLSLENTKAIKGIMAVVIVLHHLYRQFADNGVYEIWLKPFDSPMGWLVVGVFFFFSGYGLMLGYLNKKLYLNSFLKKRLPAVLIPLLTATVLYFPFQLIINKESLSFTYWLGILTGNNFLVRNCWYVYAIVVFYFLFYIIFKFIKNTKLAIVSFLFSICAYEVICFVVYNNFVWSSSSIAIALGVICAYYYQAMTAFLKKYYYLLLPACVVGYVGGMAINPIFNRLFHFYPPEFISENLCVIFFTLFVIIVLLKFRFNNMIIKFLGNISYEIYLMHGLFMLVFTNFIKVNNHIIYVVLVIAFTILSSWLLNKINTSLFKKYNQVLIK
ncbi:MAG: acyltransferase family protein [Acutalibacteraceae bacterium]